MIFRDESVFNFKRKREEDFDEPLPLTPSLRQFLLLHSQHFRFWALRLTQLPVYIIVLGLSMEVISLILKAALAFRKRWRLSPLIFQRLATSADQA